VAPPDFRCTPFKVRFSSSFCDLGHVFVGLSTQICKVILSKCHSDTIQFKNSCNLEGFKSIPKVRFQVKTRMCMHEGLTSLSSELVLESLCK
jgi:hypothetical protein